MDRESEVQSDLLMTWVERRSPGPRSDNSPGHEWDSARHYQNRQGNRVTEQTPIRNPIPNLGDSDSN
jgi:hypothetical protein